MARAGATGARAADLAVSGTFAEALRRAYISGRGLDTSMWYDPAAECESWLRGGQRTQLAGSAIVSHLGIGGAGSSSLIRWSVVQSDRGLDADIQFQESKTGVVKRHVHRVQFNDQGRVVFHVVYPAQASSMEMGAAVRELVAPWVTVLEPIYGGLSGACVFRAVGHDGRPMVVKEIRPEQDWLMRATHDQGREAQLWTDRVFEHLPSLVECPIEQVLATPDGFLLVMSDVTVELEALAASAGGEVTFVFAALAALHEMGVDASAQAALVSPVDRLNVFGPDRATKERLGNDLVPKTLTSMWERFATLEPRGVVERVLSLLADPWPLLSAADVFPQGVLHGDPRLANLGRRRSSLVAIDWGLAGWGPVALDGVCFISDASFWSVVPPSVLELAWFDAVPSATLDELDMAVIFHAVMGEVAFLAHELHQQVPGSTRLDAARVDWWMHRLALAFDRTGI